MTGPYLILRLFLYAAVIGLAPTLPEKWMVAAQAGLGGLLLGRRLLQLRGRAK